MVKYDGSKFTIYRQSDGLPSNNINDILVDNNGVWICTNGGLANFNNGGFKIITTLDEKSDGLTGLYGTTAISKSRDGIYFIGGAGIRMYDPNSLRTITTYEGMPVPNNWTSGITDLLLDKDGSLWAASLWNGLYKINGEIITKNYNKENMARVLATNLRISTKYSIEMYCHKSRFISINIVFILRKLSNITAKFS